MVSWTLKSQYVRSLSNYLKDKFQNWQLVIRPTLIAANHQGRVAQIDIDYSMRQGIPYFVVNRPVVFGSSRAPNNQQWRDLITREFSAALEEWLDELTPPEVELMTGGSRRRGMTRKRQQKQRGGVRQPGLRLPDNRRFIIDEIDEHRWTIDPEYALLLKGHLQNTFPNWEVNVSRNGVFADHDGKGVRLSVDFNVYRGVPAFIVNTERHRGHESPNNQSWNTESKEQFAREIRKWLTSLRPFFGVPPSAPRPAGMAPLIIPPIPNRVLNAIGPQQLNFGNSPVTVASLNMPFESLNNNISGGARTRRRRNNRKQRGGQVRIVAVPMEKGFIASAMDQNEWEIDANYLDDLSGYLKDKTGNRDIAVYQNTIVFFYPENQIEIRAATKVQDPAQMIFKIEAIPFEIRRHHVVKPDNVNQELLASKMNIVENSLKMWVNQVTDKHANNNNQENIEENYPENMNQGEELPLPNGNNNNNDFVVVHINQQQGGRKAKKTRKTRKTQKKSKRGGAAGLVFAN